MSTALAHIELTDERVALLKRTLCPDLTNDEMELFAGVARRTGLDPFAKQIYAMKRRSKKPGTRDQYEDKLTIQTGIDGFRVIAGRTGDLDGQDGPFWCGPDGEWRDVWLAKEPPAAAKVVVFRKGCARGFVGIARFSEYGQFYDGKPSGLWGKMPATMIAKCAEALALRKAFPADLSGLYAAEEMQQADEPEPQLAVVPVEPVKAAPAPTPEPPKQLPAAPKHSPDPDGIDRTADRAVKAGRELLGDPMNDSAAIRALAERKGWDWPNLIRSINDKFKTTYGVTSPWRDIAKPHREKTIAVLKALPDRDSVDELIRLVSQVATAEKTSAAAVFQRYQVAAKLPESRIEPKDLDGPELVVACKAFRAKLGAITQPAACDEDTDG